MDNWYTSIELAVHLAKVYKTYLIGTFAPEQGAPANDVLAFPFARLSTSENKLVNRGWMN